MSQPEYSDICQCEFCGEPYEQQDWNYYSLKYCSDACRDADAQNFGQTIYFKGSNVRIAEMNNHDAVYGGEI